MSKILGVIIAIVLLCLCVSLVCAITGVVIGGSILASGDLEEISAAFEEFFETGNFSYEYSSETTTPIPTQIVIAEEEIVEAEEVAKQTIQTLNEEVVPIARFDEVAIRLKGVAEIPPPPTTQIKFYAEGDFRDFNMLNSDENTNFLITARLEKMTEHAYFWIEDGISFNIEHLEELANEFEIQIYPTNQEFFGSEWSPGIDGDPRIFILYVKNIGNTVAGFYISADESHILANPYSNMAELFVFNADTVELDEEYTKGVLAHEYQHMIHWNLDQNEDSWLNEGFSELASFLNGYNPGGFDYSFMHTPDYQLNNWPADGNTSKNYGSSFLFVNYLLNRLGEDMTRAIVANKDNGFNSIDAVLIANNFIDDERGNLLTADELVQDWMIANFLHDSSVMDGRFVYQNYPNAPQARPSQEMEALAGTSFDFDVSQYGADYLEVNAQDGVSMQFEGGDYTTLLPTEIQDGSFAFWSNKGDASDMRLTGTFDFSDTSAPLTLQFSTWFDIEEGWDYVYLLYSDDNGASWNYLKSENGTAYNPQGNNFNFGWSSTSDGWIDESIDISALAGKEVLIRFEYVTDAAVNNEGMLIDSLSIPEIDYATSFESEDEQWVGEGFVRVSHLLPQTFNVAAILDSDGDITVDYLTLTDNTFEYQIEPRQADKIIFVVSGTTRFTRQRATYSILFK